GSGIQGSEDRVCAPGGSTATFVPWRRRIAGRYPPIETALTQIAITRTTNPKPPPADETLAFGKVFTDHMFLMNYDEGQGWHDPRIVPYGPFTLDPATCVLHYGQAIFDGLKAFR